MCAVSAVHQYFQDRQDLWPQAIPLPGPYYPPMPHNPLAPHTVPAPQWDRETFEKLKDVLKRLDEIDRKLGEPDCVDPAKERWVAEVESRLSALEGD